MIYTMREITKPILYMVIPCYNEEEMIDYTIVETEKKITNLIADEIISEKSKILFVDDGSKDKTWEKIETVRNSKSIFSGVKLSRNRGHQNALLAGLMTAKKYCDITISMDADLQDDINVIDEMIDEYKNGSEIVYGVRNSRKKDSFFKRYTAESFYKFMNSMGVEIVYNHADFRLMSITALDALEKYDETNLFLRGIIPLIGYKTSSVYYERKIREHGESKYPLKKMIKLAMDGITAFSIKPLKIIKSIGLFITIISFVFLIVTTILFLIGNEIENWMYIIISIWLATGIQMLSLGIISEYIGRIYDEAKKRPRYFIEKEI